MLLTVMRYSLVALLLVLLSRPRIRRAHASRFDLKWMASPARRRPTSIFIVLMVNCSQRDPSPTIRLSRRPSAPTRSKSSSALPAERWTSNKSHRPSSPGAGSLASIRHPLMMKTRLPQRAGPGKCGLSCLNLQTPKPFAPRSQFRGRPASRGCPRNYGNSCSERRRPIFTLSDEIQGWILRRKQDTFLALSSEKHVPREPFDTPVEVVRTS